jgi:hypothetical protein
MTASFRRCGRLDLVPSDRVALGLGFFCGLRKAEVYSLLVRNVNSQAIVDFQRKGGMRTGSSVGGHGWGVCEEAPPFGS